MTTAINPGNSNLRRCAFWVLFALLLLLSSRSALAGTTDRRIALERLAPWVADQIGRAMPAAEKYRAAGIEHLGILLFPMAEPGPLLGDTASNAVVGIPGVTEVWPKDGIRAFVDIGYLDPAVEPQYDPATIAAVGGQFKAAQALLLVHWAAREEADGRIHVAAALSLWSVDTAEKLWGARTSEVLDLGALEKIVGLVEAGRHEEAMLEMGRVEGSHPEWAPQFAWLRARSEKLREHAVALAKIRAQVNLGEAHEAYRSIRALYQRAGEAQPALADFLADVRGMLLAPVETAVAGDRLEAAAKMLTDLESGYPGDQLLAAEIQRLRNQTVVPPSPPPPPPPPVKVEWWEKPIVLIAGAVVAVLVLVLFIAAVIGRGRSARATGERRRRGVSELEKEAAGADDVKTALKADEDLRAGMATEIGRAGEALAAAERESNEAAVARVAGEVRELLDRLGHVPAGAARDFLSGRVPRENLKRLLNFQAGVKGKMRELTSEARAVRDAVAAGSDPAASLAKISRLRLELNGWLDERQSFFGTAG